jgi:acyl-coenzyme A synthetase/AMP-(fatty) acid ligase
MAEAGRTISYGELNRLAESIARGLSEEGVVRGDRVAIYLDNRIETVVAIFAALKAGAAFMMVNPTTKQQKLQQLLDNARASALVTCERGMTTLAGIDRLASLKAAVTLGERPEPLACGAQVVAWSDLSEAPALPKAEVGNGGDLAALLYTSGSTGAPKGVMLSHLNVETVIDSVTTYLELTADDVTFCVLPLSFGYGLTHCFRRCTSAPGWCSRKASCFRRSR